jgi:hypothetical protein
MSYMQLQKQRDVEAQLMRMVLDLGKMDILVMNGNVHITGQFIYRETRKPVLSTDLERLKQLLHRVPGIHSVSYRLAHNSAFA